LILKIFQELVSYHLQADLLAETSTYYTHSPTI
jgi:hypothetical protein